MMDSRLGLSGGRGLAGHVAAIVVLVALVWLVFGKTLDYGLVWDDHVLTTASVYSSMDVMGVLTRPANGYEYLPVRDLSLVIDYMNNGGWWGGFHRTNVVIYSVAVALVYLFYFLLLPADGLRNWKSFVLAFFLAAVFALHPLQVEPVSFIGARNALLALLFSAAACVMVVQDKGRKRSLFYWAGLMFTVLAMFSKATSVFLPVLFVVMNLYLYKRCSVQKSVRYYLPYLIVTALVFLLHITVASRGAIHEPASFTGILGKLPNIVLVPEFYLYKFLWPFRQIVDYPVAEYLGHKVGVLVLSVLFVVVAGAAYFREAKRRSLVWLLLVGSMLSLLPVMNLLPTTPAVADRYAQLPLVFIVPLVLFPFFRWPGFKWFVPLVIAAVGGLTMLSYQQVDVWKSDVSLFGHTLELNPGSVKSMHNLGSRLWIDGDKAEALEYFRRASSLVPNDMTYDFYRARYAEEAGDLSEALEYLNAAVKKQGPFLHFAYLKLGQLYAKRGEYDVARKALEEAIRLGGVSPQDVMNKREAQKMIDTIDRIQKRRH